MKTLLFILNISHSDIARRAGVSQAAVSTSMKRKRGVGYDTACRMLEEAKFNIDNIKRVKSAIKKLSNWV